MVQTEPDMHCQRHEPDSSFSHEHNRSRSPSAWQRKLQVAFLAVHGESGFAGCLGHLLFGPDHATAGTSASARAITVTARANPECFIAASEAENSARVKRVWGLRSDHDLDGEQVDEPSSSEEEQHG